MKRSRIDRYERFKAWVKRCPTQDILRWLVTRKSRAIQGASIDKLGNLWIVRVECCGKEKRGP